MNQQNQKQQEIKEQKQRQRQEKERQVDEILSGIVDTERRMYTFKRVYEVNGKRLQGTFEAKYMSITDRLRIGVLRAKYLDGAPSESVDALADDIAYMIAYLQVALIKAPKWWNYEQLSFEDDMNKLREVYTEVYNFNKYFREYYESTANAGSGSDTFSEETMED